MNERDKKNIIPRPPAVIDLTEEEEENIQAAAIGVFDSLEQADNLPEENQPQCLKTALLKHQKQAL